MFLNILVIITLILISLVYVSAALYCLLGIIFPFKRDMILSKIYHKIKGETIPLKEQCDGNILYLENYKKVKFNFI